ncbi:hypothetical protein STEG23_005822 [Scotinomys teguina]
MTSENRWQHSEPDHGQFPDKGHSSPTEALGCPSTEEWIRKMWYIYTMEYYTTEKNNDIMKFAGKWMELENVILSKYDVDRRTVTKNHYDVEYKLFTSDKKTQANRMDMKTGPIFLLHTRNTPQLQR